MLDTVARLVGHNLLYRDLIADNGLTSGLGKRLWCCAHEVAIPYDCRFHG